MGVGGGVGVAVGTGVGDGEGVGAGVCDGEGSGVAVGVGVSVLVGSSVAVGCGSPEHADRTATIKQISVTQKSQRTTPCKLTRMARADSIMYLGNGISYPVV